MRTNEENVVVKDRNKNAQRFFINKKRWENKNVKKRVFYFKIKNVKNVFNIYALNKNVLRFFLNTSLVDIPSRRSTGRAFHARGPAMENACDP